MRADDPRRNAQIKRFEHVSSSKKVVCTGESFGSYNYAHTDEVYPPGQKFIPVDNGFGSIDYLLNPNYRP